MATVSLVFNRQATVMETGGCTVEVDDPTDWDEIVAKANELNFNEFLIAEREYDEMDWEFEPIPGEEYGGREET